MNDDDDFGDLYAADVGGGTEGGTGTLYEVTKVVSQEQRQFEDGDEEELLYGTSSSSAVAAPPPAAAAAAAAPAAVTVAATSGFEVGGKDVENEETFLYGELYGSAPKSDDAPKEERKGVVVSNGNYSAQQQVVAPGLAPSSSFRKEEVTTGVAAEGAAAPPAEEDWDSDSDDGLQIVLNDDAPTYDNPEEEGKGEFYEGSDDEDEEELIIMAGDETLDGQEDWGEEGGPLLDPPLPGPPSGGPPGAVERTVPGAGGDDRGPPSKPGGPGSGPRIGYSGQGYYNAQPHHAQYKYVRPGSGASTGPGAGQAGELQPGGRGVGGGPNWGAGRGGDGGRGDWGGRGRGGSNSQRGQQGGAGPWGSSGGRGYSSGLEFNLPPTKTVFDIDLDALEEKSWQRPGADITDFFNFGFTENSWKQYCQQLAQLRLEATMQSKIRVYESGRSEQEYDPDLPPELMAAQGLQDTPGEYGNIHQRQSDHGAQSGGGRGRGVGRGRPVMPTGRAIQVEGGGGERRPSADIRRQRTRDSDAVIQIVLQDASEDEPEAAVAIDYDNTEDESKGGKSMDHYGNYHHEEEMRDFGPGGPGPWMMDYNPYYDQWEGNMGVEGHGPFPMGPGMGVEGHGPFPMGPGMPMRPPGAGPDFAMFPGGPFGMPPYDRGGVGRPPMYGGPRGGPGPMAGPGPDGFPPDHFGMQPPPVGFADNSRRRTPPRLAHPDRAGPHSGEWEDELSNGSGANRSGHGAQGNRDRESLSREYDADTKAGRRSRSEPAEKGPDDPALEQVSGGQKRSKSKEEYTEGDESELGDKQRPAKRTKVVASNIRRSDAKSSGSSSSDENTESSLDNFKEPAPPRVRGTDHYQKVPRHNESTEHHHHRSDSGSRRRPADTREREDLHRRDRDRGSHGHRGVDDAVYDRKSREDRERRDYDEARRRDRADERSDDARKRGRPDARDHRDGYHREREEPSRKRELEESGHWPRPDSQKSRVDERSRHADRREKDTRPYDRDRERARSRGREDARSHQRDGNRSREEVPRIEHDEERSRENHRRDDRLDERREDTRSRGGDRVEENRERELRSRRHLEDRPRESEDRRKGEDRSTRSESHRKLLVNGRETGDDARLQIRSRREGSEVREADVVRNGSSLAKERSRDHAYDERRREREKERDSGRLSSHHDEENRRDHKDSHHQDKDHASERGDARNSLRSKRPQAGSRRVGESEDPSGAYPTKAEAKQFAVEAEVSSGDEEGHERRGRSKIQRWNSRNEREIVVPTSAVEEKRHRRPHAREGDVPSDAPNDQNASEKRQDHKGRDENHNHQEPDQSLRSDSRDWQQSSSGAKRHPAENNEGEEEAFKAKELRSGVVATKSSRDRERESVRQSGGEQQQQQVPDAEVTAKLERRKERFDSKVRLKKPSEEMASRDEADPVQADPVEVKQERPARKRRWAASG